MARLAFVLLALCVVYSVLLTAIRSLGGRHPAAVVGTTLAILAAMAATLVGDAVGANAFATIRIQNVT